MKWKSTMSISARNGFYPAITAPKAAIEVCRLFETRSKPTAVISASDAVAFGAPRAAHEPGIDIPGISPSLDSTMA